MATTDLEFAEPGSLPKPGPIGRLVRLAFGLPCIWYVVSLVGASSQLRTDDGHITSLVWNGAVPGLFLVSYIINIGFSRAWKKWPAIVSGAVFVAIAAVGYFQNASIESELLARAVWAWEIYLFSHLGAAFAMASLIGTPGCEMRAFHDLYSRATGVQTKEHYCPVGPLHPIDQWESHRT